MLAAWPSPPPARLPRSSVAPPRCFRWPPGRSPWAWPCSSRCGRWGWGWSPWPWPGSPSRAWFGLRRRGLARFAGLGAALVALVSTGVLLAVLRAFVDLVVFSGAAAVALGSRRVACTPELPRSAGVPGPPVVRALPAGERAVLLINPRSGADKAQRYRLAEEARLRGIEAVVLQAGDDLAALADAAVAGRPQSIGMAGGDGSMAVVAARAAAHDIAFVCVPAGTRNHLALDLGVDRDDPVGALEAFTDGIERRVDLAEVNGRVFVNNVSLGVYARV